MSNLLEQIVMIIRDGCKEQKCKTCHCKHYKHGVGCGEMYRAMKIYDLVKSNTKEIMEKEGKDNDCKQRNQC